MMEITETNHLPIRIAVGSIVGLKGSDQRYIITQLLPGGQVGVRVCGANALPEPVCLDAITHAPLSDAAKPADVARQEAAARPDLEINQVAESAWSVARWRLDVIQPLLDATKRTEEMVAQRARQAGRHVTTVYRWLEAYENSGHMLSALLAAKSSVPKGTKCLAPAVEELLVRVIKENYLTNQRRRVVKIDQIMRMECEKANLRKPHINTIYRRVNGMSALARERPREGKNKTSKLDAVGTGNVARYPLEQVQIDHTQLNVMLVDDQKGYVLGRPYITVAIDVFSRMIVGYYVAFEKPSALSVGMCISQAILSKTEWLREHASAFPKQPDWPCYGKPVTLHLDNAREFRGRMLKRACEKYGINIQYRPVKTPHFGGHIESFNDKLSDDLRDLPGATFSNPTDRGTNYDSSAEAAINVKEFLDWLANHILCVYHYRSHSALDGRSPLQRWEQGYYEGTELAPPVGSMPDRYTGEAAERLKMDFLPCVQRKVSEQGVQIEKIHYMHPTLREWIRAKDPSHPKRSLELTFRCDPRDVSIIYFWNPKLSCYEPVPYRNSSLPAATLWEVRAARKYLREQRRLPDGQQHEAMIFSALKKNRELVEIAQARKKKAKAAGMYRPGVHEKRVKPTPPTAKQTVTEAAEGSVQNRVKVLPFED